MFQFWYRFVRPNISAISQGAGEAIYYKQGAQCSSRYWYYSNIFRPWKSASISPKKQFYIFSKTGFTEEAMTLGKENHIRMIRFEDFI